MWSPFHIGWCEGLHQTPLILFFAHGSRGRSEIRRGGVAASLLRCVFCVRCGKTAHASDCVCVRDAHESAG